MKAVHVLFKFTTNPYGGTEVDTTSGSGGFRQLSPFVLGPIDLPDIYAENFENLWQFSKVYPEHVDADNNPNLEWYEWRERGFADKGAHRYPMGKGRKPLYSIWYGRKLDYIKARKGIYATVYAEFVRPTNSYKKLEELYGAGTELVLRDYDAYDHIAMAYTLKEVINNPRLKCGHAFVLAMMLQGELEECLV